MNQALAQRLAARYWMLDSLLVEAPTNSRTSTGEPVTTWTTVYPSVFVPNPRCHLEQIISATGEKDQNGQPVAEVYTYVHVDPSLVILPTYRFTVNGVTYTISKLPNADETFQATLKILVVKVQ